MAPYVYRAAHGLYGHVVQQDYIRSRFQCLLHFCQRFTLYLDFEQVGSQVTCKGDSLGNASCCLNMVILDKHTIAQIEAMISTSTQAHGFFFQAAQAGCCLACIEYTGFCSLEGLYTASGYGRYAGEMAQEIHRDTLGAQ